VEITVDDSPRQKKNITLSVKQKSVKSKKRKKLQT